MSKKTYSLCILECPDEEVNESGDRSVFSERGVIGRAESQIPKKITNSFKFWFKKVFFNYDMWNFILTMVLEIRLIKNNQHIF